jgi:FAD/FMN-containing dehydrogenase/Fe-S oxidoreductase
MPLSNDFVSELSRNFSGEVRTDLTSRLLFSTDASLYQIEPLGVAFPKNADALQAAVELAARYQVPVLARGAGSSLAGQAVGPALVLDCSRYLNKILDINVEQKTVTVEPGVVLAGLDRSLAPYGLQFGPDPASAERATAGGSLANNATGAHSILYGMCSDHILQAEVVLSDGQVANMQSMSLEEVKRLSASRQDAYGSLLQSMLHIRESCAEEIHARWPRTWRNSSGYALNYLAAWSASQPQAWERVFPGLPYPPIAEGQINPAQILAGSEGTLAVIRRMTFRVVPRMKHTVLGVLAFRDMQSACRAVAEVLEHLPSAVELVPQSLVDLARSLPAYASQFSLLDGFFQAGLTNLLIVEFGGDDPRGLKDQAARLGGQVLVVDDLVLQKQVWSVRKIGMGLVMSRPGAKRPLSFIEDMAVPVDRLGEFTDEIDRIMKAYGTFADVYGHASAGCLHIRPLINIKAVGGPEVMRKMASEAVEVVLSLGGTISGEHGDGIARASWLERMYGKRLVSAFQELKQAADPHGILNPGKIVFPGRMEQNLRVETGTLTELWDPALDFSRSGGAPGREGLLEAVEMCNGAGVCRKSDGVMCPSFQATQDEMHSTRGRANLMRAMMYGLFPGKDQAESAVREALDLCLACKGCKAECPSSVDMAKLKYEFTYHYYQSHLRKTRDYLFAYIDRFAAFGMPFYPIANAVLASRPFSAAGERLLGLSSMRKLPRFTGRRLSKVLRTRRSPASHPVEDVIFLNDAFNEYFQIGPGLDAAAVIQGSGGNIHMLPVLGAGRTLISKGFLDAAKRHSAKLISAVHKIDPEGRMSIVGLEPSEIYTLIDEYPDFFPGDEYVRSMAARAWMVDEFLIRPGLDGLPRLSTFMKQPSRRVPESRKVLLHGHCYQKSRLPAGDGYPVGVAASRLLMEQAGFEVNLVESTCCGMAGAFGYEAEHYKVSMDVGELGMLPQVRAVSPETIIAAAGVSCQAQIKDGARRSALHPVQVVCLGIPH